MQRKEKKEEEKDEKYVEEENLRNLRGNKVRLKHRKKIQK